METGAKGGADIADRNTVIGDDELAALALSAADSDPFDPEAVPFADGIDLRAELLPEWYMPAPQRSASTRTPGRVFTVSLIVFALVALNGVGLCVTYGVIEIAW